MGGTENGVHIKIYRIDANQWDLKSPGGNTVWVRPPPALPNLRELCSQVNKYKLSFQRQMPAPRSPGARVVPDGVTF